MTHWARQNLLYAFVPSIRRGGRRLAPDCSGFGRHAVSDDLMGVAFTNGFEGLSIDNRTLNLTNATQIGSLTNSVCVSSWFTLSTTGVSQTMFAAHDSGTFSDSQRMLAHCPWSDGNIYWDFGGPTAPNRVTCSGLSWSTGVLYHCLFTVGGFGSRVYRDGSLVGSTSTQITRSATSDFWLGRGTTVFPGSIFDFRIYSSQFSDTQVQMLYQGGIGYGLRPERPRRYGFTASTGSRRRRLICGAPT